MTLGLILQGYAQNPEDYTVQVTAWVGRARLLHVVIPPRTAAAFEVPTVVIGKSGFRLTTKRVRGQSVSTIGGM